MFFAQTPVTHMPHWFAETVEVEVIQKRYEENVGCVGDSKPSTCLNDSWDIGLNINLMLNTCVCSTQIILKQHESESPNMVGIFLYELPPWL